mmetsp:Transcript_3490/g.2983  ORF Transcript_3490/g.2983 Transcript_3490/m.2983 type:complete len:231 (+) Transcript_3490:112-804(+)
MQQKDYKNNFISGRSSTKRIHEPGGGSSIGSLLFGGAPDEQKEDKPKQINKENTDNQNQPVVIEQKEDALKSNAEHVREFTFEAGQPTPDKPQLMDTDKAKFITKMILDEVLELLSTVLPPQAAKEAMKGMIDEAKSIPQMDQNDKTALIAEQGDAFVDIWYYSLNCMAKQGVNLSKIFDLVHGANMAKRDPATGKFIKRADGKIIKPKGWTAPNVEQEIERQMKEGSWK